VPADDVPPDDGPPAGGRPRFHLAVPVHDLAAARRFYGELLGCPEGRTAEEWVDFDLYGHQFVAHLDRRTAAADAAPSNVALTNQVDGDAVPVPHFGVLLSPDEWRRLADRLTAAGTEFVIEPHTRFAGEVGEQSTMFLLDPSGNALEFKAFADDDQVFPRPT
jgi:extradiol dioxygenase family protein